MLSAHNIAGPNKVELLNRMWDHVVYAVHSGSRPEFDGKLAANAVRGYIDWFMDRPIRCDLSGNMARVVGYFRDSRNALSVIIQQMRADKLVAEMPTATVM